MSIQCRFHLFQDERPWHCFSGEVLCHYIQQASTVAHYVQRLYRALRAVASCLVFENDSWGCLPDLCKAHRLSRKRFVCQQARHLSNHEASPLGLTKALFLISCRWQTTQHRKAQPRAANSDKFGSCQVPTCSCVYYKPSASLL